MTHKPRALLLTIPVVCLGIVVLSGAIAPRTILQVAKGYLRRTRYLIEGYLQSGELPPYSAADLDLTAIVSPTDAISEMLAEVDRDRAETDLRRLTGEEPLCTEAGCTTITHRLTGSEELSWAMDYLHENLAALGYTVEFQDWSLSGYADRNLIARKTGVVTPTEEIYLVSHVDGVKLSTATYPAADDNASSVVNGLELARIFSTRQFDRTVVLLFTTGEEQGRRGATAYLDALSPDELAAIKYVINRDATGYDANGDAVMELGHGDHPPSVALAQVMGAVIDAYQLDLVPHIIASCP